MPLLVPRWRNLVQTGTNTSLIGNLLAFELSSTSSNAELHFAGGTEGEGGARRGFWNCEVASWPDPQTGRRGGKSKHILCHLLSRFVVKSEQSTLTSIIIWLPLLSDLHQVANIEVKPSWVDNRITSTEVWVRTTFLTCYEQCDKDTSFQLNSTHRIASREVIGSPGSVTLSDNSGRPLLEASWSNPNSLQPSNWGAAGGLACSAQFDRWQKTFWVVFVISDHFEIKTLNEELWTLRCFTLHLFF